MLTYAMSQRDEKSKYYYLYSAIKEDILSGTLKKNEKLPSKRSLAEHLGISLITVETAYQMLKDEGYIESRERSGYYVTELKLLGKKVNFEISPRRPGDPARLIACSDRARKMLNWQPKYESAHDIIESAWKWQLKFPEGYAK